MSVTVVDHISRRTVGVVRPMVVASAAGTRGTGKHSVGSRNAAVRNSVLLLGKDSPFAIGIAKRLPVGRIQSLGNIRTEISHRD